MKVTKEMVLAAKECVGIQRCYGSNELVEIRVLPEGEYGETTVYRFNCGCRKWGPGSDESYWDLYESELMLTVMKPFTLQEVAAVLEEMGAFTEEAWQ